MFKVVFFLVLHKKVADRTRFQRGQRVFLAPQLIGFVNLFDEAPMSAYVTEQDEGSEETGEDVTRDDSWDYSEILWNGIRVDAVQKAFEKLDFREQTLLEKQNAICMTCGRVSSWKDRPTFEDLAVMFEGTTAGGAERAYRRAVEHLTELLVEDGDPLHNEM